jgi:Zn-dependent M16 (insulinase) family peptidase
MFNHVGDRYRDFVLKKITRIEELQATFRELVHEPSGAVVLHLENEDPENLFCLSFQTLPKSSNGAPHILEHTVLCGSEKFPVKDPFFAMGRRSLNTFMNALTGSDFTCYPAASQVEKDFYNLLDVYIDAVFRPNLRKLSFLQEGHRLEFTEPQDPTTPLERKGIVYNEMKGSLTSGDARIWHEMMKDLCPDLPYAYNSGGDPEVIPTLTYEELRAFHENYYHPSRCLFFFYGNFPLRKHLDFIAEHALKGVVKQPPLPPIPAQKRFSAPVHKKMRYPINETDDLSKKTIFAFGWLTTHLLNQEEVLALSVIDAVLMDTDASPLKRALLESGLCIQADGFMDTEMSEVPYVIVCKGCETKNGHALESLLKTSLQKIVKEGLPSHLIEAAIHQLEFSRTEITGDSSPFGLTLFMRSALAKQHGSNPEDALMIHSLFAKLIEKAKDPHYLTGIIRKYFLDNPHHVQLECIPDPKLTSEELAKERKELDKIQSHLTSEEKKEIASQAEKLAQYQIETEHQKLDCLPKVDVNEIPSDPRNFSLEKENIGSFTVFHHACFTNHIVYADVFFDLPQIREEDLPYVQLMLALLPEIGAANRDYAANLEYIQAYTGGVGAHASLYVQGSSPVATRPAIGIRGKALIRNRGKLLSLLKEMITSPHFHEKERIKELIIKHYHSLHNRLGRNAQRYAIQLSLSGFSVPSAINDSWHGLKYFKAIQAIAIDIDRELPKLLEKFATLKTALFSLHDPHLILSCSAEMYETLKKENFYDLLYLSPSRDFAPWRGDYSVTPVISQGRILSSPVAFTSYAFNTVPYSHPDSPALSVSTQVFDNKILHAAIREKGGAYGSGAAYAALSGNFYFTSYRDPNIAKTLHTFNKSIEAIAAGKFDEQDLEEAKLGMIQQYDSPVAPGSRALTAYNWWREGRSFQTRQHYRHTLLNLTVSDIRRAVETHLLPQKEDGVFVCFASSELLEKENVALAKKGEALALFPI